MIYRRKEKSDRGEKEYIAIGGGEEGAVEEGRREGFSADH